MERNQRPKEEGSQIPNVTLGVLVFVVLGLLYIGYQSFGDGGAAVKNLVNTPLDTTGRNPRPIAVDESLPMPTEIDSSQINGDPLPGDAEILSDASLREAQKQTVAEVVAEKPKPTVAKITPPKQREEKPEYVIEDKSETKPKITTTPVSVSGESSSHTVQAGETFYGIANRYNLKVSTLKALNPQIKDVDKDVKSGVTRLNVKVRTVHTVGAGDVLRVVAEKYGVTVQQLMQANRKTKNYAERGEKLIIPIQEKQ